MKTGVHRQWRVNKKHKIPVAYRPGQTLQIDIVGAMPQGPSENQYMVTLIDRFSRFLMIVPCKDIRAFTITKAFEQWIGIFGPPETILSDNGSQFVSKAYQDYCKSLKKGTISTKPIYTSTYNPQANGQIERVHRWIKERLRLIAYDNGQNFLNGDCDWVDYLSLIMYIHNNTPSSITNISAQKLIFGFSNTELTKGHRPCKTDEDYMNWMNNRRAILQMNAHHDQVMYRQSKRLRKIRKNKTTLLEIGTLVLWDVNARFKGNQKKFGPRWQGPYEVIDVHNEGMNYTIRVPDKPQVEFIEGQYDREMNHPTNPVHKKPRRVSQSTKLSYTGHAQDLMPVGCFNVLRSQLKPYFRSYREMIGSAEAGTPAKARKAYAHRDKPKADVVEVRSIEEQPPQQNL
jgi:transposase InsO family protein